MIRIQQLDHLGIRVMDAKRAIAFYEKLGFKVQHVSDFDAVTIMVNDEDVELNLITNGNDDVGGKNVLMDVEKKHPGFTHVALRVASIKDTLASLTAQGITPSQGPVTFGGTGVSVFIRDPDRNVIELRGRDQKLDEIPGLKFYEP
ncbi:MAG: VOC family protein [Betaproteobacteria bacterium]|nr:VOC family protein [Betaproteobacteria bacterium]